MHTETSVTALDVALPYYSIKIQRVVVLTNSNKSKITVGHCWQAIFA